MDETEANFNRRIIEEFRANGGRVGGSLADTPILLLHHIGARSGIARVTPLAYTSHPDGYLIVASNGGSPAHPRWYHNLKAHATIEIEVGTETFAVRAAQLEGAARDALWRGLVAGSPSLVRYQARAAPEIPVFVLLRADPANPEPQQPRGMP